MRFYKVELHFVLNFLLESENVYKYLGDFFPVFISKFSSVS